MKMNLKAAGAVALSLALAAQVEMAQAGVIDFESTPVGTYNTLTFNGGEATLTFLGGNGNYQVNIANPGVPIVGHSGISFHDNPGSDPFKLSFSGLVSFVQVGVGDFGADEDETFMEAFDSMGTSLGMTSLFTPAGSFTGGFLTLSIPNISYVHFWEEGSFAGALYWDSISYEGEFGEAPEPATLGMLGLALAGLGLARRKR